VGLRRDVVDVFSVIDVHKHTCDVVVATASICLRGRGSNPFGAMCIFLILARRRLYGGMRMRMRFAGRGNENDRYRMVAEHRN
jgi:hypothetical protein